MSDIALEAAGDRNEESIFGPAIVGITRAKALEDGHLVDVTGMASELGFTFPVAITKSVHEECVQWTDEDSANQVAQEQDGRLFDVLYMLSCEIRRTRKVQDRLEFGLLRVPRDGHSKRPKRVELKALMGRGDSAETVLTIMLVEED